jgi:mannosyltransferase
MFLLALSQPLSALLVLIGHTLAAGLRHIRAGKPARYGTAAWLAAVIPSGLAALTLVGIGYRSHTQISWIQHLTLDTFQVIPDRLFLSGAVGGIVLGLAIVAVRRNPEHLYLAAAGFVPLLALLAADQFTPIWVARYVVVALPPLAALAAATMHRIGRAQTAAALAVTTALSYPAQLNIREPAGHSEDSAKITAVISPLQKPGDVVVVPDTHPSIPWAPRDIYERYLPTPRPPDVLHVAAQRTNGHFLATECPNASCLGTPPRIWIVRVDNPTDPYQSMNPGKQKRLRDHYRPVRRWSYPLLDIILAERTSTTTKTIRAKHSG